MGERIVSFIDVANLVPSAVARVLDGQGFGCSKSQQSVACAESAFQTGPVCGKCDRTAGSKVLKESKLKPIA